MSNTAERFNDYVILRDCGRGAFGTVHLAEEPVTGRHVALKIIPKRNGLDNFDRELKGLRRYCREVHNLDHLIQIFSVEDNREHLSYTMELADNAGSNACYEPDTLARRIKNGPLPVPELLRFAEHLICAIEALHAKDLVHRDIKPNNIVFVNGKLKLCDISLLTSSDSLPSFGGTLGFLPPEYTPETHSTAPSVDLYAFGKVCYCMMTGNHPNEFPRLKKTMLKNREAKIINRFICRICNQNPLKRPHTIEEVRTLFNELVEALNHPPVLPDLINPRLLAKAAVLFIPCLLLGGFFAFRACTSQTPLHENAVAVPIVDSPSMTTRPDTAVQPGSVAVPAAVLTPPPVIAPPAKQAPATVSPAPVSAKPETKLPEVPPAQKTRRG